MLSPPLQSWAYTVLQRSLKVFRGLPAYGARLHLALLLCGSWHWFYWTSGTGDSDSPSLKYSQLPQHTFPHFSYILVASCHSPMLIPFPQPALSVWEDFFPLPFYTIPRIISYRLILNIMTPACPSPLISRSYSFILLMLSPHRCLNGMLNSLSPKQILISSMIAQLVKNSPAMKEMGSMPGLGRSPGEGKGYSLQYSGLENCMDYIVHGVAKSWT